MKVGDYVRTKEGYICKILEIHEEYDDEYLDWNDIHSASIRKSHIVKSSKKLIDLIEIGDYVNGRKVYQIGYNFQDDLVLKMSINEDGIANNYEDFIYEKDIKSIVTKEQFESMEYKVGE